MILDLSPQPHQPHESKAERRKQLFHILAKKYHCINAELINYLDVCERELLTLA